MMSLIGIIAIIVCLGLLVTIALAVGWAIARERDDRARHERRSDPTTDRARTRAYLRSLGRKRDQ